MFGNRQNNIKEKFEDFIVDTFVKKYYPTFCHPELTERPDKTIRHDKMVDYKFSDGKKNLYIELGVIFRDRHKKSLDKSNQVKAFSRKLKEELGGGFDIFASDWELEKIITDKNKWDNFIIEIKENIRQNECWKSEVLLISKNTTHDKIKVEIVLVSSSFDSIQEVFLDAVLESFTKFENCSAYYGEGSNILLFLSPGSFSDGREMELALLNKSRMNSAFATQTKAIKEIYSIGLARRPKQSVIERFYPKYDCMEIFFDNKEKNIISSIYEKGFDGYFKNGIWRFEV